MRATDPPEAIKVLLEDELALRFATYQPQQLVDPQYPS